MEAINLKVPSISELEQLTSGLYAREYVAIKNTKFPTNSDKLRCYEHAKEAQDSVNQLLDLEKDSKPLSTEEQRSAAEETCKYVRSFILFALKGIRNMRARADYLNKVKETATEQLTKISSEKLTVKDLESITQQAADARNLALEMIAAKMKDTSKQFSDMIAREGLTYEKLVNRYSNLRYQLSFKGLDTHKKAIVFADIIEASGRVAKGVLTIAVAKIFEDKIFKVFFGLGMIVWDVVTSRDPVRAAITGTFKAMISTSLTLLDVGTLAGKAVEAGLVEAGILDSEVAGLFMVSGIASAVVPFINRCYSGIHHQ